MTREYSGLPVSLDELDILIDIGEQEDHNISQYAQNSVAEQLDNYLQNPIATLNLQITDDGDELRNIASALQKSLEVLEARGETIGEIKLIITNCELDFTPIADNPSLLQKLSSLEIRNCCITPDNFSNFVNLIKSNNNNLLSAIHYNCLAYKGFDENLIALNDKFLNDLGDLITNTNITTIEGNFEDIELELEPDFQSPALSQFGQLLQSSQVSTCKLGNEFADNIAQTAIATKTELNQLSF